MKLNKFRFCDLLVLGTAAIATLLWASAADAAIPDTVLEKLACTDTKTVDCLRDDVFVVEGTPDLKQDFRGDGVSKYSDNPTDLGGYYCSDGSLAKQNIIRWNCKIDNDKVVDKFLRILREAGWTPDPQQWDQVAVFQIDTAESGVNSGPGDPMLFFRAPAKGTTLQGDAHNNGAFSGVNEVTGTGLPKLDRNQNFPFVGYVVGGSTTDFGIANSNQGQWDPANAYVPKGVRYWLDPDPAGLTGYDQRYRMCNDNTMCFDNYNGYQALAQATSSMFGPYLREEPELQGPNWMLFDADARSKCSPSPPSASSTVEKVALELVCAPCGTPPPPVGDAGVADGGAVSATVKHPCPPGYCPQDIPLPKVPFDAGGLPILNLAQSSGTKLEDMEKDKLAFGEPALSVCPDGRQTLASRMAPRFAEFDKNTGRWVVVKDGQGNIVEYKASGGLSLGTRIRPRIWNAFIDLDGSLMGAGVNWIENANRSALNGGPNANRIASPPHRNARIAVFNPLELWLMGWMPLNNPDNAYDGVPPFRVYNVTINDLLRGSTAQTGKFSPEAGPRMGMPQLAGQGAGAAPMLIASSGNSYVATLDMLLRQPPVRSPDFAAARHYLRQAWIVVTKPEQRVSPRAEVSSAIECRVKLDACVADPAAFPDDADCNIVRATKQRPVGCLATDTLAKINARHIDLMTKWRKGWQQYFYMLAGYRGRVISTFNGVVDDSAYWEFAQKGDDEKTFVPEGGLTMAVSGPHKDINSTDVMSFANVATTGLSGLMRFKEHTNQLPIKIPGDPSLKGNYNAVLVRMMVPRNIPAKKAWAEIQLANGPTIRLPGKKDSFLVPDGQFHTYNAQLWANEFDDATQKALAEAFTKDTFTGFSFAPSTAATKDCDATDLDDLDCIKVEYIRFVHVDDPEKADDLDLSCDHQPKGDGWIGLEDNCPRLYNPGQADADGNGIGDDCEDFDKDTIANVCDNCPSLTNSRQLDYDEDGSGDTCDDGYRGGCFLAPDAVAGQVPDTGSRWPLVLAGLSILGVFAGLRFRRRGK